MSKDLYLFSPLPTSKLNEFIQDHQDHFNEILSEYFTEKELEQYDSLLESLGSPVAQPLTGEMSFSDFVVNQKYFLAQEAFYKRCKAMICLEGISDLFFNPFQVSYLVELFHGLDEVLIDAGAMKELSFKAPYLLELKNYKNIFSLLDSKLNKTAPLPLIPHHSHHSSRSDPMDQMIKEVASLIFFYKSKNSTPSPLDLIDLSDVKTLRLYAAFDISGDFSVHQFDSTQVFKKSNLTIKDFGDHLEKLKFALNAHHP